MIKQAGFSLGGIYLTPGAMEAFGAAGDDPARLLRRHRDGDWGEMGEEDWRANDQALVEGTRLLSSYTLKDGTQVWIITEADRSATTLLLPDEY